MNTTHSKTCRSNSRRDVIESLRPWTSRRVLNAITKLKGTAIKPCGILKIDEKSGSIVCVGNKTWVESITIWMSKEILWYNDETNSTRIIELPFVGVNNG